jgi:hypothetical protein
MLRKISEEPKSKSSAALSPQGKRCRADRTTLLLGLIYEHANAAKRWAAQKKGYCTRTVSQKFTILFLFLHRRSHRRADMTGSLLFYLVDSATLSAFAAALTRARAYMLCGLPGSMPVM